MAYCKRLVRWRLAAEIAPDLTNGRTLDVLGRRGHLAALVAVGAWPQRCSDLPYGEVSHAGADGPDRKPRQSGGSDHYRQGDGAVRRPYTLQRLTARPPACAAARGATAAQPPPASGHTRRCLAAQARFRDVASGIPHTSPYRYFVLASMTLTSADVRSNKSYTRRLSCVSRRTLIGQEAHSVVGCPVPPPRRSLLTKIQVQVGLLSRFQADANDPKHSGIIVHTIDDAPAVEPQPVQPCPTAERLSAGRSG